MEGTGSDMSSVVPSPTLHPGDVCWVENLCERWGGGLAGVVFQGHYEGPLDSGEMHHVRLMEDDEDLDNVMQDELKASFELQVGDFLGCCNEERDGWGDGLFEGELIEVLEGGHMVVEFEDETCNDVVVAEVYHVRRG